EENNDNARHEVLRAYYFLGEELEKRLTDYKQSMEEHEAQKKVNDEVRDQLPNEVSKNALRKKTERARKIYDLFFRIGGDKVQRMTYIQRIKTFTAPSISNLSSENIKYVALQ
ncbi:654_t:CDS:1, partial [Ambispora gerdemannii]